MTLRLLSARGTDGTDMGAGQVLVGKIEPRIELLRMVPGRRVCFPARLLWLQSSLATLTPYYHTEE